LPDCQLHFLCSPQYIEIKANKKDYADFI